MKLWIFDLDGTLVDSFPTYFRCGREALTTMGVPRAEEILKAGLSMPMKDVFLKYLSAESAIEAEKIFRKLSREYSKEIQAYDGIHESLTLLKKLGKEISIWTMRDRESTLPLIQQCGLTPFVDHVITGTCVKNHKPHPEGALKLMEKHKRHPKESLVIGDHVFDVTGAKNAGAKGIRASWNSHWGSEKCNVADHQFTQVSEFKKWIEENLA